MGEGEADVERDVGRYREEGQDEEVEWLQDMSAIGSICSNAASTRRAWLLTPAIQGHTGHARLWNRSSAPNIALALEHASHARIRPTTKRESATYDQRTQRAIFDQLCAHNGVPKERPKRRCHKARMDGRDGRQRG